MKSIQGNRWLRWDLHTEEQNAVEVEMVVVAARARHGKMAVDHERVPISTKLMKYGFK